MNLEIFTICLDAQPWITFHYPQFERLPFDWRWHVIEGVASNAHCTHWCAEMAPRLSNDGTTEYLDSIAAYDPRVIIHRKEMWHGKISMVNEPLRYMHAPALLLECDADEIWTTEQIIKLREMFMNDPTKNTAQFYCDYRVGRGISITSVNKYGNNSGEWKRAWRFTPGMRFKNHEPPSFENHNEHLFTREQTKAAGLVFRHEAYSTEKQVAWKEQFYGSENNPCGKLYHGAVKRWRALQRTNQSVIPELKRYLPWCGEGVTAERTA